ncbi:MAG: peptidylprolyl isomerase fpr4 [Caeruleum heppii]|nr:MAG: peptidylprolyl isomerase fpr4 [Caeruleum heppii]
MTSLLPVAVYGLEVPAGDVITPAVPDFPATFRITMAAIDPSAEPQSESTNGKGPARATLKILRQGGFDEISDEDSDEEDEYLRGLLGEDSDEDDEESIDQMTGEPSDPAKSKKARKQQAMADIKKALEEDSDNEMELDGPANGVSGKPSKGDKGKGKAKATDEDEEDEEDSDDEGEELEVEEFALCTLDPEKNYQQPLDITIGERERVFFKVSGTHTVYLTGNYVVPASDNAGRRDMYDDEDDEYDLSPGEDEFDDEEDESDELDDMDDPRITELDTDEDVPKLIKSKAEKKGKNKRAAEESDDEPANLDEIMAKSLKPAETTTNGEPKLSKKQAKKLKNNAGEGIATATDAKSDKKDGKGGKETTPKSDKKVQFAKELEQKAGAAAKESKNDGASDKKDDKPKAGLGVKVVQGVTVDDKKLGTGPAAKKGDKVSMRYIGKLKTNNQQFDANKSGPPFSFKLGSGEVIKGWDIGVAGMSVGGERRLTIPPNLAYGKKATGQIPASSTLVFDLKLMGIK